MSKGKKIYAAEKHFKKKRRRLFASLPYIGDLFYHHIYLFYEEPQIFSCITKSMQLYFAVAIPSENDEDSAWLLAPISSGKLLKAEKNAIEIRDLLLNSESLLFKIEEIQNEFSIAAINPETLTEDLLPEAGELLDFAAGMEILHSAEAPLQAAAQGEGCRDDFTKKEILLKRSDNY